MAKSKFIEGQICEFLYIKNVFIEEDFMVFEDKDAQKHLIPSQYYRSYQLKQGTYVKCLVSKVDCTGKVAFEPEHPYYKIGATYDFDFVEMQITVDTEYNPISEKTYIYKDYQIIVADKDGNQHRVVPRLWQRKKSYRSETIKCRINRIVKGHFNLINLEEPKPLINRIINTLITKISNE